MEGFEGQPRDLDEGPGLLESVWRYKWLVAVAALLGALLGYGWQARQPTVYEGSTRLLMSIGSGVLPGESAAPAEEPRRFLSNQAEVIASRPVLQRAANATGGRISAEILRKRMTVEVAEDADVITIRVRDATADGAARLAQAVGRAYDQFVIEQSSQAAAKEVERLEGVADQLNAQLRQLRVDLRAGPDPILEAKQEAAEREITATVGQIERLRTLAKAGSSPVQFQEPIPAPEEPVQPVPRRWAMAGLLLGLVGSAAFAWWLNSRAAEPERAEQGPTAVDDEVGWARPGPALGTDVQAPVRQDAEVAPALDGFPAAADVPADGGGENLRSMFDRLQATLGNEPLDWYLDNFPQVMAEQLTTSVHAEMVAVLLDNGEGALAVAGGIGLTAEEHGATVSQSHDVLRQALADGVGIFKDGTHRSPTAATGLPGSQSTEALVMVPLVQGPSWFGMLLVGRRSDNGQHVASFDDQELARIITYAGEMAPMLQTLLLLERLQGSVRSLDLPRDEYAEPAGGSR